jgi:hypothetical protein
MQDPAYKKRGQKRFAIPVIGHFADRSIRFNSILEAERITGISYTLIYEACVGKIYKARNVYWEFENGAHYIHYKAFYIRLKLELDESESMIHGHTRKQKLQELQEKFERAI